MIDNVLYHTLIKRAFSTKIQYEKNKLWLNKEGWSAQFEQVVIITDHELPNYSTLNGSFCPKAARVLRVLLTDHKKPWRLQALAEEAKVSLGLIANIKSLLEDRKWLKSSDAGLLLKDPDNLLTEWSETFNSRKNIPGSYYTLKIIAEIEADLAKTLPIGTISCSSVAG